MDIPVCLPGIEGQNLTVRTAGFFGGARLVLNGQPLVKQNGFFHLRSNAGSMLALKLKGRFLDPIPNLLVGGETIQLVPALTWYQYAWMTIPIVLVFLGGAIGGTCGGLAAGISSRVFRSGLSSGLKYALSGFISLAAFLTYFTVASTIIAAMHK